MSDQQPAVTVARHGHVLVVTLNRPAAMNAVNAEVSGLVGDALELADRDAAVHAVVLTGAGERAFCAGADLKALARGEPVRAPGHAEWGFAGYVRHPISKPTIAAVNGFALGGGTELVLASDLAVAAETATLGLPEVARGLFAGAGGAFRLSAQVPRKAAMELLLTGASITAARGCELGLVNRVVPAGQALAAALSMAQAISVNAPLAVQAAKRVANSAYGGQESEVAAWQRSDSELEALRRSADAREGAQAFAEKRAPVWRGR
jgi:crotonobetainyl-CoA hydratase